jgi:hypothetical protein
MLLIIESSDEQVLQKITELIQPFNVAFRKEPSMDTVSPEDQNHRIAVARRFKGRLKKYFTGYQPSKHEWYQQ